MKLDDAVTCVQLYGPREVPGVGRRQPAVVSQEVIIGWWEKGGGVTNRRARIEGLDGESVVFHRVDTDKRWACPAADLIYIRRWPEA